MLIRFDGNCLLLCAAMIEIEVQKGETGDKKDDEQTTKPIKGRFLP